MATPLVPTPAPLLIVAPPPSIPDSDEKQHIHLTRQSISQSQRIQMKKGSRKRPKTTSSTETHKKRRKCSTKGNSRKMPSQSPKRVRKDRLFVGAIDLRMTRTRFVVVDPKGSIVAAHQISHQLLQPSPGHAEIDPEQIIANVEECIAKVLDKLHELPVQDWEIISIGISNQRDVTLAWNSETGKPLQNAMVWHDKRCVKLAQEFGLAKGGPNRFKSKCGLSITSRFVGLKLKWLLNNVAAIKTAQENNTLKVGSMDAWVIYKLCGGVHKTDITNAARTMLMNIHTHQWDNELCNAFDVPVNALPTIVSCSEKIGVLKTTVLRGVRVMGCLADQQAIALGQGCVKSGEASATYGSSCSILVNTGTRLYNNNNNNTTTTTTTDNPNTTNTTNATSNTNTTNATTNTNATNTNASCSNSNSKNTNTNTHTNNKNNINNNSSHHCNNTSSSSSSSSLVSTVAFKLGPKAPVVYALEGCVAMAGTTVEWLRDKMKMIDDVAQCEELARTVEDTGDTYYVPAFSDTWLCDSSKHMGGRGCIIGMGLFTNRAHICRAVIESVCFQCSEVLTMMERETHTQVKSIRVNGGLSNNDLLMQIQSNTHGIPVYLPVVSESSALGAAFAAGLACGVWNMIDEIRSRSSVRKTWKPKTTPLNRAAKLKRWREALKRSQHWATT